MYDHWKKSVVDVSTDRIQAKRIYRGARDVMSADLFVTSGVLFWQRLMKAVHNKIMIKVTKEQDVLTDDADEISIVSVKKNWMPTLSWKGETLILHAIPKVELMNSAKTTALTSFAIDYSLAEKFGFVVKTPAGGYKLGPNLQFTLPDTTYTGLDRTLAFIDKIDL